MHKQRGERTYPQLLNVPRLEAEVEPKPSETHASVLSSELSASWLPETAPDTLAALRFYKKCGMYFKRQN